MPLLQWLYIAAKFVVCSYTVHSECAAMQDGQALLLNWQLLRVPMLYDGKGENLGLPGLSVCILYF